jgi:hypothetical protein
MSETLADRKCCPFCSRAYKYRVNYDKHVGYCEFVHKSSKQVREEMDGMEEKIPSVAEMFGFLKDLSVRVEKLERENLELKARILKDKKKVNILDWLNGVSGPRPKQNFTALVADFPMERLLQTVFAKDISAGVLQCFESGSLKLEEMPIRTFTSNGGFYIYDTIEPTDPTAKWQRITNSYFDKWIVCIERRFLIEFKKWCDEKEEEISKNDEMKERQVLYFQKLLGMGRQSDEGRFYKIRQSLSKTLRTDLKNMAEIVVEN